MEHNKDYIVSLNADSSLQITKGGELVVQMTKDELINATAETLLGIVAKRLDGVEEVAGASTAIQAIWNEFAAIKRNDTNKSTVMRNLSVSWTVEVSEGAAVVIDRKIVDPEGQVELVSQENAHNTFLGIAQLDAGIESNEDQPIGELYKFRHGNVHLNDPRYVGENEQYDKTNIEYCLVNGYDRARRRNTKVAITVGESYLITGFNLPTGEAPTEQMSFLERDGDNMLYGDSVIRYNGNMFTVRNVTPILGAITGVADDALRMLTGLESSLREKSQTKQITKALVYTGDLTQQFKEITEVVKQCSTNHLISNEAAPINSLYFLPESEAEYACHNSAKETVLLAKGLGSLQAALSILPLSNANTLETAIAEYIAEGQQHHWVRGTHGLAERSVDSTGDHCLKYAACAAERIVDRMIDRIDKILFTCDAVKNVIADSTTSVLQDKLIADFTNGIVIAAQALEDLLQDLSASPARNTDGSAGNVPVELPKSMQLIVGINPNELIDYSASANHSDYHITFYDNLHYRIYDKLDANGDVVYTTSTKYGLHVPGILSLERLLEDEVKFERVFRNSGLSRNTMGNTLFDYLAHGPNNGLSIAFDPNVFNVFNYVLGISYNWMYKDVRQYSSKYSGFKHLVNDVMQSGHSGVPLAEVLARVNECVKANTIQVDRVFASQFKFNGLTANRSVLEKYPVATISKLDMSAYTEPVNGKVMSNKMFAVIYNCDKDSEEIKTFDNFEPVQGAIPWDGVHNLIDFEHVIKTANVFNDPGHHCFFGPTYSPDDVFGSGNATNGTYHRSVLLMSGTCAPVLFSKRYVEQNRNLMYNFRSNNKADVADLQPYGEGESAIWKPDGFTAGCLFDAYVLIQERPLDVTPVGNKLRARSHTTIADNRYYFAPVEFYKYDDSSKGTGISAWEEGELKATGVVLTTGGDKVRNNDELMTKRVLISKDILPTSTNHKGRVCFGEITDDTEFGTIKYTDSKTGKAATLTLAVEEGVLTDVPTKTIVYSQAERRATQISRYGYRRPLFINSIFEVSKGDSCRVNSNLARVHDITANGVWSPDPIRLLLLRPNSYDIQEILRDFNPGMRADEAARPYESLLEYPLYEDNGRTIDRNYNFNHVKRLLAYSDVGLATLTGQDCSIDAMAIAYNCPLNIKQMVHFPTDAGQMLRFEYRDLVTTGVNHAAVVRVNGDLVTPVDDRYIDHVNARYLRGLEHSVLAPALFIPDESGNSTYECIVMWIGCTGYYKNRRLTERNNFGKVYSIAYPRLAARLRDERRTNKFEKSIIRSIFIDGESDVVIDEGGNENDNEEDNVERTD